MKKFLNQIALLIGLLLVTYPYLARKISFLPQFSFNLPQTPTDATVWQVKSGSIYDGDTLRLIGNNRELKVRLCGIDAPERDQELGIEARDYLRSLIAKGNGTVYLVRAGEDKYGRTVGELFMPLKSNPEQEIHLNTEMISAGMAWHYKQYSGDCPNQYEFDLAENNAKQDKVGVYSGNHQPPWEWRKALK